MSSFRRCRGRLFQTMVRQHGSCVDRSTLLSFGAQWDLHSWLTSASYMYIYDICRYTVWNSLLSFHQATTTYHLAMRTKLIPTPLQLCWQLSQLSFLYQPSLQHPRGCVNCPPTALLLLLQCIWYIFIIIRDAPDLNSYKSGQSWT